MSLDQFTHLLGHSGHTSHLRSPGRLDVHSLSLRSGLCLHRLGSLVLSSSLCLHRLGSLVLRSSLCLCSLCHHLGGLFLSLSCHSLHITTHSPEDFLQGLDPALENLICKSFLHALGVVIHQPLAHLRLESTLRFHNLLGFSIHILDLKIACFHHRTKVIQSAVAVLVNLVHPALRAELDHIRVHRRRCLGLFTNCGQCGANTQHALGVQFSTTVEAVGNLAQHLHLHTIQVCHIGHICLGAPRDEQGFQFTAQCVRGHCLMDPVERLHVVALEVVCHAVEGTKVGRATCIHQFTHHDVSLGNFGHMTQSFSAYEPIIA